MALTEAVMQRDDLALHARGDGLAFHLDSLPDDEVADLEVEGFFLPGVHRRWLPELPERCSS